MTTNDEKKEGRIEKGDNEPSPTQSLKSEDTSLPFSRRIFPKYLNLGGVACVSRILTRKGAISVVNIASVAGSVFNVGTTNSVKAIFAIAESRETNEECFVLGMEELMNKLLYI